MQYKMDADLVKLIKKDKKNQKVCFLFPPENEIVSGFRVAGVNYFVTNKDDQNQNYVDIEKKLKTCNNINVFRLFLGH